MGVRAGGGKGSVAIQDLGKSDFNNSVVDSFVRHIFSTNNDLHHFTK